MSMDEYFTDEEGNRFMRVAKKRMSKSIKQLRALTKDLLRPSSVCEFDNLCVTANSTVCCRCFVSFPLLQVSPLPETSGSTAKSPKRAKVDTGAESDDTVILETEEAQPKKSRLKRRKIVVEDLGRDSGADEIVSPVDCAFQVRLPETPLVQRADTGSTTEPLSDVDDIDDNRPLSDRGSIHDTDSQHGDDQSSAHEQEASDTRPRRGAAKSARKQMRRQLVRHCQSGI